MNRVPRAWRIERPRPRWGLILLALVVVLGIGQSVVRGALGGGFDPAGQVGK